MKPLDAVAETSRSAAPVLPRPAVLLPERSPLLTRSGWSVFALAAMLVCVLAPLLNLVLPREPDPDTP